ncbi:uncharacterized protein [Euwallacea similis]|uniref:uncharacterized protein n=1 Tax=Euwallacea similis TaxID=1736056 RepID=UPI00345004ED
MVVVQMQKGLIDSKSTLNRMVNTLVPDEFSESEEKEPFDYQLPQVRASFTLKVSAPEPQTLNLLESNKPPIEVSKELSSSVIRCGSNVLESQPNSDAELVENSPQKCKPCVTVQPSVIDHQHVKPVRANRSSQIPDDDKDFEIPLEESLKAVEEFIRREKELSKWQVGEDVLAKWKGNGLYYKAKIMEIFPSGVVNIVFETYDVKEEIDYKDLCKFFKKTNNYKKKGRFQGNLIEDVKIKDRILPTHCPKENKLSTYSYKKRSYFISHFKRTSKMSKRKKISAIHKVLQRKAVVRQKKVRLICQHTVKKVAFKKKK